jgi:SAM-dependent methyltransferase
MSTRNQEQGLSHWFGTSLGRYLLDAEIGFFDAEVADLFGFNALQLGLEQHDLLRANRMPLRVRVGEDGALRAAFTDLPIQTASVDLVILPHALEFSAQPHQVLREVARVLVPEGHVLISCFNPWSLWGLRRAFTRHREVYPWCGDFINLPRLKDWMALLGFELTGGRMRCYVPPLTNEKWVRRLRFLESTGDRWWPFAGGIFFLHGVKRVRGMRVITPRWKSELAKSKSLATAPHRARHPDDVKAAQIGRRR